MKNKIILTAAVGLALGASSCRKFLNVNNNPNISQTATVQTLLPAAELYIGTSVGVDLQIYGSIWAQYWTQNPAYTQYVPFEQYAPTQDAFSKSWTNLYAGAENFYQLYNLADSQNRKQYQAIALLMQAYTFQVITDAWGDAPYKQALEGLYANGHLLSPKYDSQKVVYNGIIAKIDSANKLINSSSQSLPGADDLIYGGDMSKWKKFSNTLKLKVLLRLSAIDPAGAQARVDTFYKSNPVFIGTGDDAKIAYGSGATNNNPLYSEEAGLLGVQNLAGSKTCIDSMNANGDPRVSMFYEPVAAGVVGLTQGSYDISAASNTFSIPNIYVAGDAGKSGSASAPVNLLTSWESYFLQAEVVARTWQPTSSGYTDLQLFRAGISANFTYYATALANTYGPPVTGSVYNDYITGIVLGTPGNLTVYTTSMTMAKKLRLIAIQKWFAMCGNQGFEAWTEWRRTGYPDFLVIPKNSEIGTNRPERFLYPTSESTGNGNFPATGVAPVTSTVWWDVL